MFKLSVIFLFLSTFVKGQFTEGILLVKQGVSHGSISFSYEAAIQNWTVPAGVTTITVSIASASGALVSGGNEGLGVSFSGSAAVTSGHIISVMIGFSSLSLANGGGGTFIYDSNTVNHSSPSGTTGIIAIAGGGGGGNLSTNAGDNGGTDLVTNAASDGEPGGTAGTSGNGGTGGGAHTIHTGGGGGTGWLSNGTAGTGGGGGGTNISSNFSSYTGGGGTASNGAGGGGGYNGGGGGNGATGSQGGGGGGGSYFVTGNTNIISAPTANITGNGSASITW